VLEHLANVSSNTLKIFQQHFNMPKVRNPILPGFNADPAVVRVGEDGEQREVQPLNTFANG
jgi:hypothetical protein